MNTLHYISKTIIIAIATILLISSAQAQNMPKTFNYQAVARTTDGYPIADKKIVVEISILKGIDCDKNGTCPTVWQETHTPTTNEFGLFSIEIGGTAAFPTGTRATGVNKWTDINWNDLSPVQQYYVKIRVDFGDAEFINGLLEMGTSKLQSVPYARVAEIAQKCDTAKALAKDASGKVSVKLVELTDVNIVTPVANQILLWDGTKWKNSEPTISIPDIYLKQDGSTDLTSDWTISKNNVTLTSGKLSLGSGSATLTSGSLTLASGNLTLTAGNLLVGTGLTTTKQLKLSAGATVNYISIDGDMTANSDAALSTEKAIKTYVDKKLVGSGGAWTENSNYIYYNGPKNVGIGTSSPEDLFHLKTSNCKGFLVTGDFIANGTVPDKGAGTRMAFYPCKAAFRAGTIENEYSAWNNANVGKYTAAFGHDTKASGDFSFAVGETNKATGSYSFVGGNTNEASGAYSFSMGNTNSSKGSRSVTLGQNNNAFGVGSIAIGDGNTSNGINSICFGQGNKAGTQINEGNNSIALGLTNQTKGIGSLASGMNTLAAGDYSATFGDATQTSSIGYAAFATGGTTQATGMYSFTAGFGTKAISYGSFIIGRFNLTGYDYATGTASDPNNWVPSDAAFVIGNGSDNISRSDAFYVLKDGNAWMAGTLTQSSDIRLKQNIIPLHNSLSNVIKLQGINYYWNKEMSEVANSSSEMQTGLSAQEVEKVYPELVKNASNGYKSVNYIGLIPVLIEAIKEQQNQIDELKKQNEKLQKDNTDSKSQIENLTNKYNELNSKIEEIEKLLKK